MCSPLIKVQCVVCIFARASVIYLLAERALGRREEGEEPKPRPRAHSLPARAACLRTGNALQPKPHPDSVRHCRSARRKR